MAVLMIAEVPGLTEDVYAGMVGGMMPGMRAAKGFVSHAGGPSPSGGWRVVEVWDSQEDWRRVVQQQREAQLAARHQP